METEIIGSSKISLDKTYLEKARSVRAISHREKLTVMSMVDLCNAGRLVLPVPYARNITWTKDVGCQLIESAMVGLVVPEIFVRRTIVNCLNRDQVVDGKQRCMTLLCFYNNENPWDKGEPFRLSGCQKMPILNGLMIEDFPELMMSHFLGYALGAIIAEGTDDEAISEHFRLIAQPCVPVTA